ncbi:TIGR00730 family Rossman fold protein [Oceanobacter mangrovi]|uniref:LOG family protein n=1 Tax=Oceanobacter mangrovi TaxID=2862510 RepID=UPI001C8D6AAC|nr:TIGR00730 family Rossman fold protein [Oceanobacter mangrovi]
MIKRVAIYCGSKPGKNPAFATAAAALARQLANAGIAIVYGGSHSGLMGVVADAALAAGGEVIGVMPGNLQQREKTHQHLSDIFHVETMHERKAKMAELADAFIALPGGIGTLDELVEVWCWANIGDHQKPCICFDVDNFWQPFFDLLGHIEQQGFAHFGRPGSQPLQRFDQPAQLLAFLHQQP